LILKKEKKKKKLIFIHAYSKYVESYAVRTTEWLQWLVAILLKKKKKILFFLFFFILQPVDESGYSRVKFGAPDLFVRCSMEGKTHNQSFLSTLTSDDAELESGEIVWRIPAGMKTHAGVVSFVTFISALLSTLFIVLTCIFYSDARMYKTLKQS
jgi:hypothetical protein